MRIVYPVTIAVVRDSIVITIFGIYFIVLAIAVMFAEPYANKTHNKIDIFLFLVNALAYVVLSLNIYLRPDQAQITLHYLYIIFVMPAAIIILLYGIIVITSRKILPKKCFLSINGLYRDICVKIKQVDIREEFPYRFEHETENSPLLHNV